MTDQLKEWWETMSEGTKTPIILVLAALMGGGASLGQSLLIDQRPDPWTGTQALEAHRAMREEYKGEADRIYKALQRLETRMDLRFDRLQDIIREHDEHK